MSENTEVDTGKTVEVQVTPSSPENGSGTAGGSHPITKTGFWLLTIALFLCLIANGLVDTARSLTYPMMKEDLNLTYVEYGALESMGQFSYLFWALVTAFMMQSVGFKVPFVLSILITILGCIATGFTGNFWLLMCFQFIGTCLLGALDDGPSAVAVILFTKNTAALYCIMAGMYGLGAFLGPLYSSWIHQLKPAMSYRGISFAICLPLLLIGLFILCIPFAIKRPVSKDASQKSPITVLSCLKSPLVWYCSFLLNLMAIAERGTLNWGTMYVRDVLHLTDEEGAKLNSRFYFCFMLARFVGGFITDFLGPFTMEYIIIPIGVTIYIVGFALGTRGLNVLPFVGLFVSLYWPTMVITCTKYWGKESSIPVACMLPLQSGIGAIFQYLLGVMNEKYGPQYAYWMSVPAAILGLVMLIFFHLIVKKKEKKQESGLLVNESACSVCCRWSIGTTVMCYCEMVSVLDNANKHNSPNTLTQLTLATLMFVLNIYHINHARNISAYHRRRRLTDSVDTSVSLPSEEPHRKPPPRWRWFSHSLQSSSQRESCSARTTTTPLLWRHRGPILCHIWCRSTRKENRFGRQTPSGAGIRSSKCSDSRRTWRCTDQTPTHMHQRLDRNSFQDSETAPAQQCPKARDE